MSWDESKMFRKYAPSIVRRQIRLKSSLLKPNRGAAFSALLTDPRRMGSKPMPTGSGVTDFCARLDISVDRHGNRTRGPSFSAGTAGHRGGFAPERRFDSSRRGRKNGPYARP